MKKKLLFLGALMLTSIGAFAQATATWVQPTLEGVKGTTLTVGDTVYLYNKEAGGFFRGLGEGSSPHWGSRAGVALLGADKVIIQKPFTTSVKEGTTETTSANDYGYWMTESTWDGTSYIIQNYASHITSPRIDEVWFGLMDFGSIWTDRQNAYAANENFFWDITPNDNGTYTIAASNKVPWLANKDLWETLIVMASDGVTDSIRPVIEPGKTYRLGVNLDDVDHVLNFEGLTVGEDKVPANLNYEWTIVSQDDYNALVPAIEELTAETERYNAAVALKAYIEAKDAEFADAKLDFSAAWAVYNNLESTTEELTAAKDIVNQVIIAYQESQATPDNPSDMSSAIVNGTFDTVGDFTGWSGTSFAAGGTTSTCAEHYNKSSFHTYQDIKGLPNGVYAVTVKGFYRAGSIEGDWQTKDDPSVRHARLFAVSGTDSLTTAIPSLSAAATDDSSLGGLATGDNDELWIPNTMADFTTFKEAGKINDVRVVVPVNNGTIRIGVVKNGHISTDWMIVDDFKLMYYGKSFEAYDAWRTQVLANYPTVDQIIPDDETLYTPSYRTAYEEALATATAETETSNFAHVIGAIQPALDALYANIAAYKAYVEKADVIQDWLAGDGGNLGGDSVAYLSDYFMDSTTPEDGVYPNGGFEYIISGEAELTTEQVEAEIANLDHWQQAAIKYGMVEGADVSNLLVNPKFADGFTGWTTAAGGTPSGAVFTNDVCPNVEFYYDAHGSVDVQQTITDVSPGIYSISIQAFERPAGNGSYDGTEATKTVIFMNDFESPVMNIVENGLPVAEAVESGEGQNCLTSNDYTFNDMYLPNGMEGASYAFAGGSASYPAGTRYLNKCYGIVGDDGVMTIGLTSHGQNQHWVLMANFTLIYEGKSDEAIQSILASTIETATAFMEERGSEMTTPALNALMDAIGQGEAAEGADYETSYAALTAINAATTDANANIEAYAKLTAASDVLYAAMSDYESTATDEALLKATEVSENVEGASELTTEEIIALTEEVELATAMLKVPITEGASDDNPIDMTSVIKNADFSTNADDGNWTIVKEGIQNGPNWGGGNTGNPGFEFWNNGPTSMKFDINQTLVVLPAGKYALGADVANSMNGVALGTNGGRAHLYATVIAGTDTTTYSVVIEPQEENCDVVMNTWEVIFDMPADAKVQIGVKSVGTQDAQWFAGDNFTLKYFGAESAKENSKDTTPIEDVESAEEVVPVAIYSISGARLAAPQKGINIIKMSNGSVKKVLVK